MKITFGPIGKSGSSRYMEAVMACLADRADVDALLEGTGCASLF